MSSLPLHQEEAEASASESQGALDASDADAAAPAPAPVRSPRCRALQGAVVLLFQLGVAGLMANFVMHRHGASSAAGARGASSLEQVQVTDQPANASTANLMTDKFALNKTKTGCLNTADIRLLSRTVVSSDECAYWCRGMVNCLQFNFNPNPSDEDGGENCVLFRDWCDQMHDDKWSLYNDAGGKITNDAAVLGFDSRWEVETNQDFWIFDDTCGCPRSYFECPVAGVADLIAAGAPPQQAWQASFDLVAGKRYQAGDHVCDEATGPRLLAKARISPSGLGSRMNNFANEALWAMWAGMPLTLCTPVGYHDSWPTYFEAVNFSRCSECGGSESVFASGACAGAYASRSLMEDTLADMKRYIYSRLFAFNAQVLARRDALLKQLGLTGEQYIGVHIRRGDKIRELVPGQNFVDVDIFAQKVRESCVVLGKPTCKVYVASDWADAVGELQRRVPEMQFVAQERLPEVMYNVRNDRREDEGWKDQAEASFVLDLSMLVNSDVFVGTSSSNVGRFIYFMRPANKTSVSLDDAGSFLTLNC